MPYTITQFQVTPNPHALKCVLDRRIAPSGRSYRSREEAPDPAADPLGAALFAIPGVTGVLIQPDWFTISKSPDAEWSAIRREAQRALRELP